MCVVITNKKSIIIHHDVWSTLKYIVHITMERKYVNHTVLWYISQSCKGCTVSQDYRLNFGLWGDCTDCAWHGGVATIEESEGDEVWGVVWRIDNQNLHSLDRWDHLGKHSFIFKDHNFSYYGQYCIGYCTLSTGQKKQKNSNQYFMSIYFFCK